MIVIRVPFRLSFVGGGSDIDSFYKQCPGSVISTSINKYIYINIHEKFEHGFRIAYSKVEDVKSIQKIEHPIVRNSLNLLKIKSSLEIASIADIPGQGTGLGSSSSYAVGLLLGLITHSGKTVSKSELADLACEVEINLCGEPIGKQDQFAAALGGYNRLSFGLDGKVTHKKIKLQKEFKSYFESQWLVFFTGISRSASSLLYQQKNLMNEKNIFNTQKEIATLCDDFQIALENEDFLSLARIINESWELKKSISTSISNSIIDKMYSAAIENGALGGKLLGAGAGGFLFLLVPKSKTTRVKQALKQFRLFQFSSEEDGAKVIYKD